MNNDNKFLVLEVEENGAKVTIASKLKTGTIDLSMFGQAVQKGQCIRLDKGALQMISEPTGVEVNNGKVSVRTKIEGAYDAQDEECKGLVKTEFFLKVARGTSGPVGNDNELKGQLVTIEFNTEQQCWEVETVLAKPAPPRRTTGLIYSMDGEQSVRIHAPGWPVDFTMDCGDRYREGLRGQWFDFSVPEDFKTVKWEEMDAAEPPMETLLHGEIVMVRLPCWLDRESGTIRTERHEWVFDPYRNLTRYFEQKEENAVAHATVELWPLNSGAVRLMAHDKQPFIVEENSARSATQSLEDEDMVSRDGSVDEAALLKETNEEIVELSERVQKQQEFAGQMYLHLSGCKNIPKGLVQELEDRFVQLTSYDRHLYALSNSVNDALETTIYLKEGIEKMKEFFNKANTALLRYQYMNIPETGKALLGKRKFSED